MSRVSDDSALDPDWKRLHDSLGIKSRLQWNEEAGRDNQPNLMSDAIRDASAKKTFNETPVAVVTRTGSHTSNPLPVAPINHLQLNPSDLITKQKD